MNEAKPLVSFIIATYNCEDYICDAVGSILNQKYNNIEIIVIDDCSIDNTYKLLKDTFKDRVIYHRNLQNKGPAFSRNIGLGIAKGEYIGLIDSDDILYDENHTGIAVEVMENDKKVAIFSSDFYIINEKKCILNNYSPFCNHIDYIGTSVFSGKRNFNDLYLRGVHSCGALIRRIAIDIAGNMNVAYKIAWDCEFFLRLLGKSRNYLYYYHKPLTGYRMLPNSLSTNLIKMYSEKVRIYEQAAADYPSLREELGWKVNKRIALQIISLSDAYKLEKRYGKAICMIIKAALQYPPIIIFYYFSFLGMFFKKYENIKLRLLRV